MNKQQKQRDSVKPENWVRVRIWNSKTGSGSTTSVVRAHLIGGSVGHMTLETSKGYLSMWPFRGGGIYSGKPTVFVPAPEYDEQYESADDDVARPADYLFDFYSLDVEKINDFLSSLMLVDLNRPFHWHQLPEQKSVISKSDATNDTKYEYLSDMKHMPRLVNTEQPIYGPFRPWKGLSRGKVIKKGHKAGFSCSSSVLTALEYGGVLQKFKRPFNFARGVFGPSPNNMVSFLKNLKEQELDAYPETATFKPAKSYTALEKKKFALRHENKLHKKIIINQIKQIHKKRLELLNLNSAKDSKELLSIDTALQKVLKCTVKHLRKPKYCPKYEPNYELFIRDLELVSEIYSKLINFKSTNDTNPIQFIKELIADVAVRQNEHDSYKGLFKCLVQFVISVINYILVHLFDYTLEVNPRFLKQYKHCDAIYTSLSQTKKSLKSLEKDPFFMESPKACCIKLNSN